MSNNVSVEVSADASKFSAGLAQVQNSLDQFKHHASEQLSEVGGEFMEAFAFAAVIEGIKGLFEQFSQVQDIADKLGTTAESVQKLGAVAKASGVDTETLIKTLQKGTTRAYEAATGNTDLAESFEKIGVDAKEFANASPEDQLKLLAEGFDKAGFNAETLEASEKALGKTSKDIMGLLAKGPEELKASLEGATVASNETVATMKEVTEKFERAFTTLKAYGADALGFLVHQVEALGTAAAAAYAFLSNLTNGFDAAKEAANETIQAAAELQAEDAKKKEDQSKKRKPVDTDAIEAANAEREAKKKAEEELGKLREENAKKEEEARFRNLALLEKQKDLMQNIAYYQKLGPISELDTERNKGKILDYQKELEGVNKEISRDKEKDAKRLLEEMAKDEQQKSRETLKQKKEELKEAQKEVSTLDKLQNHSPTVDSLRQIGGGISGVNYRLNAAKDDMQRQQLDFARQQVEKLSQVVDALQQNQQQMPQYDGSFS